MSSTVAIRGIVAGGDGVGQLEDGMAVFVPRTAPGDEAQVEITRRKQRHAYARLVGLTTVSDRRVEPRCAHYTRDNCGGCQLQHLSPETQLCVKRRLVGDALRRIGKRDVDDPTIVASPVSWRYRSQVRLTAKGGAIGLHREGDAGAVFELEDCLIVGEPVMQLWWQLRHHRDLLAPEMETLVLKQDRAGTLHVVVGGGQVRWDPAPLADRLAVHTVTYWWKPHAGAARVVAGDRAAFPAVAFEQSNSALARSVRVSAVDGLGTVDGRIVWDLYGGVGDTAELLARRGARVWSVDSNRAAVEWGRQHGSSSVTRLAARVEESLVRLPRPDAVVVNPPRVGLVARVSRALELWGRATPGARLTYVSCDPATLARDLSRMPSLAIRLLTAFDLFPQTAHVESLVVLEAQ